MPAHLLRLTLPLLLSALALVACGPTEEDPDERPRPSAPRDGGTSDSDGGRPASDGGLPPSPDAGSVTRDGGVAPPRDAGTTTPSCTPSCSGKQCGSDGCGGSCGACSSGQACAGGRCACVPQCNGRQCGPDGCGGSCGTCGTGTACAAGGSCVCVPQCQDKVCGSDGCGGTCGTCPSNATCSEAGDSCGCDAGYVPDAAGETCVRLGGPCQAVTKYGHCAGDTWVRCDAEAGVVALPCGEGQCKTIDAQGTGACRCGSIDANGVCASADGTSTNTPKTHFTCATSVGILLAENCAESTGSSAGMCSTFVTGQGHVTSCFCSACSMLGGGQCRSLCSRPSDCRYNAPGNFFTCGF